MDKHAAVKPSQDIIKSSETMWNNFILACQIGGGLITLTLILMAVFLV